MSREPTFTISIDVATNDPLIYTVPPGTSGNGQVIEAYSMESAPTSRHERRRAAAIQRRKRR